MRFSPRVSRITMRIATFPAPREPAGCRRICTSGRLVPARSLPPSNRLLHAPWEAPAAVLDAAGVRLGADYPHPIVDHAAARERALEAYRRHVSVSVRT